MDARTGVEFFLFLPAAQGRLTGEDIGMAIKIASSKSPSSAIDAGQVVFMLAHQELGQWAALSFGKGCRWLAMVRRDEGRESFEKLSQELLGYAQQRP